MLGAQNGARARPALKSAVPADRLPLRAVQPADNIRGSAILKSDWSWPPRQCRRRRRIDAILAALRAGYRSQESHEIRSCSARDPMSPIARSRRFARDCPAFTNRNAEEFEQEGVLFLRSCTERRGMASCATGRDAVTSGGRG
jgi:hypothetical protein